MAYIFLLVTFSLWILYFYKKEDESKIDINVKEMNGYIVTSIIAALAAKGITLGADFHNKTLGSLEDYVLEGNILEAQDWYDLCCNLPKHDFIPEFKGDFDIG